MEEEVGAEIEAGVEEAEEGNESMKLLIRFLDAK